MTVTKYIRFITISNFLLGLNFPLPQMYYKLPEWCKTLWKVYAGVVDTFFVWQISMCVVNLIKADRFIKIVAIGVPTLHLTQCISRTILLRVLGHKEKRYMEKMDKLLEQLVTLSDFDINEVWKTTYRRQKIICQILLGANILMATIYNAAYIRKAVADLSSISFSVLQWLPYDLHYNNLVTILTLIVVLTVNTNCAIRTQAIDNSILTLITLKTFIFLVLKRIREELERELQRNKERIPDEDKEELPDEEDIMKRLQQWHELYASSLEVTRELTSIISAPLAVTYSSVLLNVAFATMSAISKDNAMDENQKKATFVVVMILFFALFLFCRATDKIEEVHSTISNVAYNDNILNLNKHLVKSSLIFSNSYRYKFHFTALGLFTLSSANFMKLLKTVISFVMSLHEITNMATTKKTGQ